ncbi:MAG: NVEALA domain-containing protein [Prevotellaceae bacterium]|jgi:hypothetical protein|nr:NVEALA domain-containing protein [Prevotellaceae bacterium]
MNKRKFLKFKPIAGTILGLAFATITGVNVYLVMEGQKKLSDSDVMLKNIEALSQEGPPLNVITCYCTYRITLNDPDVEEPLMYFTKCNGCVEELCYSKEDPGTCTVK